MNTVNSSQLSRHELRYLQALSRRIGANLSKLEGGGIPATGTQIVQTAVHGSPRTPHRRGGFLNISANDFKLLVSAGIISPSVRVEHSRGEYYAGLLFAELEIFTGAHGGTN